VLFPFGRYSSSCCLLSISFSTSTRFVQNVWKLAGLQGWRKDV
jgi:hypothetical protein